MSNLLLSLISICMVVDRWQPQFLPICQPKFGFVNKAGKEVIAPKYFRLENFHNGYARCVRFNEKGHPDWQTTAYIDKSGNEFIVDEEVPLIRSQGEKVVSVGMKKFKTDYDYLGPYSDGMVSAWSKKDGWSFLDKDGNVRIKLPAECCSAQPFSEGLAAVAVGGKPWKDIGGQSQFSPLNGAKFGFIDKSGKFVIPPTFPCPRSDWKSKFENGLALATVEKNASTAFGYINRDGKFVVPAKYSKLEEFSEGLAAFNSLQPGFEEMASRTRLVSDRTIQQFLRQYEIFSLKRSDVVKLLGEPIATKEHPTAERYLLQQSCLGSTYFNIRYKPDGMVCAYSITCGDMVDPNNPFPPSDWIVQEQKPDVDEYLWTFFTRASKVTYAPAVSVGEKH